MGCGDCTLVSTLNWILESNNMLFLKSHHETYLKWSRYHVVANLSPEPMYWLGSVRTLIWWRNQVVAPLSEEWTFRACMLPLLLQCFAPTTAIFVCPLFFGVAHFHHVVERIKMGMGIKHALFISCEWKSPIIANPGIGTSPKRRGIFYGICASISGFQSAYTTLFGAYAAFLFAKTGEFPLVCSLIS